MKQGTLLVILLLIPSAFAQNVFFSWPESDLVLAGESVPIKQLSEAEKICRFLIEEKGISPGYYLPPFIPYGNERVNAYSGSGEVIGHIITVSGDITSIDCTLIENPTYNVTVANVDVLKGIYNATSRADALDAAFDSGEITLESQQTIKEVKGFFTKLLISVGSFFG